MPASLRSAPSTRSFQSTCITATRARPTHLPVQNLALSLKQQHQQVHDFHLHGSSSMGPTHRRSYFQRHDLFQKYPSVSRLYSTPRRSGKERRPKSYTWEEELDEKPDSEEHHAIREDSEQLKYKLRLEMENRAPLDDEGWKPVPGGFRNHDEIREYMEQRYAPGGIANPYPPWVSYLDEKFEFDPVQMQESTSRESEAKPINEAISDSNPGDLTHSGRKGRRSTRKSKKATGDAADINGDSPYAIPMHTARTRKEKGADTSATTTSKESDDHGDYYIDPMTNRKVEKPIASYTVGSTVDTFQLEQQRSEEDGPTTSTTCGGTMTRDKDELADTSWDVQHAERRYSFAKELPQLAFGTRRQSTQPTETEEVYLGPRTQTNTSLGAENEDEHQKDVSSVSQGQDAVAGHEAFRPLTGNYIKDFPEDFSASWAQRYKMEEAPRKGEIPHERLEPAMHRAACDSSPLESRAAQSSSSSTVPTKAGHRTAEEEEASDHAASAPEPASVTLYKILAYDHHTRTIVTADASSTFVDSIEEMTPADILTQIHKPAKFLPHFGPLQAQGYEVISGSGDVVIFRKVREATEPGTVFMWGATGRSVPDTAGKSSGAQGSMSVNPIDMMGSEPVIPNIGNFTSPTGYVNYEHDLSSGGGDSGIRMKPPPPFRNGAGAGKARGKGSATGNTSSDHGSRKGKGRGARLLWRTTVGAGYMAALVYGGSVLADYFATGGETGEGPKGFI